MYLIVILVLLLTAGCGGYQSEPVPAPEVPAEVAGGFRGEAPPDSLADFPGFPGRIYQDGRVLIGGQPDQEALRALPARGVVAVINLRTAKEMGDTSRVAFDESALVDSLGLEYVEIPLGGKDNPYVPAAVESFAAALDRHSGPVLLHCASGGRASHLWAAYLVEYHDVPLSSAVAIAKQINLGGMPLEGFLGKEIEFGLK